MKALQMLTYGGPEVLSLKDIPKPTPHKGQVLVGVTAATINPFDYKLRSGMYKDMIPLTLPITIGADFSGVITEVGELESGKNEFKFDVGDEVFGSAIVLAGGSGAMAEYASAKVGTIAKKPSNLSLEESASLPLVGSSAVQALEEHIRLQKGQKILIHGGAGGIGSIAIQIAKYLGAYVATTVNADDTDFVKALGADEIIDYKTQQFETMLHDFDAVYDTVGGVTTSNSFKVLHRGGILVSMLGEPDKKLQEEYGVVGIGQNTQTNTTHLSRVAELVEKGAIHPQIEKVFSLENAQEAFTYQEKIHPRGKVIIKIKE